MARNGLFASHYMAACIGHDVTIRDAVESINKSGCLLACVTDSENKLIGIVTDSDVRRAILKQISFDSPVDLIVNKNPITAPVDISEAEIFELVERSGRREIPLLDENGRLADLFLLGLFERRRPHSVGSQHEGPRAGAPLPNTMFVLAGGLGTRLRSVVSDRPKPLAVVGDRPILERLLRHAAGRGISKFILSINYMGEMIEEFCSQLDIDNLNISYVREKNRLGTAGSIGLIANEVKHPLLVCNADIIADVPFDRILRHHEKVGADVTCIVRTHHVSVPFGVVDLDDFNVVGLREKPLLHFIINAGIYVLNPEVCRFIKPNEHMDMPELIKLCLAKGMKVRAFPIHEYWMDIGKPEDYQKANEEFQKKIEGTL